MTDYVITGPDNAKYRVTAPDGATEDQVLAYVKSQVSGGGQGSRYDPNNPVLSDDPRDWPPPGPPQPKWWEGGYGPFSAKAPTEERGTFVPLATGKSGKPELAMPGMFYDPYQGAKTVLETPQSDEKQYAREVGPSGLAAASAAFPNPTNRVPVIPKPQLSLRPKTAAAARVSRAAIEDMQPQQSTPTNPITADELSGRARHMIDRGSTAGQDVRMFDVGAESTRGEARRSADMSSRAQANMSPFAEDRWRTQNSRIAEWLRARMGNPREAHLELDAIRENSKDPKATAYRTAFQKLPGGVPVSMDLSGIMQAKEMQAFAREADRRFELARLAGNTVYDRPIQPFGGRTRDVFNPNKLPLEFWDYVKRAMDDAITTAREKRPTEALMLGDIRKQMIDELDKAVPEYKTARGVAADAFKAGDAVEAGLMIARNPRITSSEIATVRNKTPPGEWGRVQIGFYTEYMKRILGTGDRQDILKRLASTPIEREKIKAVLGRDVAEELEAMLYIEDAMQKSYRALAGGSMSPRRFARMHTPSAQFSTGIGTAAAWFAQSWWGLLVGGLTYGTRLAEESFHRRVAEHVADMLVSKDPRIYAQGIYEAKPFLPNLREAVVKGFPLTLSTETHRQDALPLPKNPSSLIPGKWYRNRDGKVMRFDGQRMQDQ